MTIPIREEDARQIEDWFDGYVQSFKTGDDDRQQNIILKEEHTRRVCNEIATIGRQLGLVESELLLADVIARLHDIGRFAQYARYGTFVDRDSENHAELGLTILNQHGILRRFEEPVRDLIVRAIRYHNRAVLPSEESADDLFFARLLRDADKLDIWRVVIEYYHRKNGDRNHVLELGLPDTPGVSEAVCHDLQERRIVDIIHVKNLNDFKLLQLGWIFDINFAPTFRCIRGRRYLEMIRAVLPESEQIDAVFAVIDSYLDEMQNHSE